MPTVQTMKARPQHRHRVELKGGSPLLGPLRAATVTALAAAALAFTAAPAWAQYKVVQPDGRVTYTDRPPAEAGARVTAVGPTKPAAAAAAARPAAGASTLADLALLSAGLPLELRNAVQRYPVMLLTAADCPPCDNGRRLLQQRGIPHAERRVVSADDAAALEKLLGTKTVPGLMIGTQALRGFVEADWNNFLDAAGYPRDSRLPKAWKAPAVSNLVEKRDLAAPQQAAAPEAPRLPPPSQPPQAVAEPLPSTPGRIRF